MLKVIYLRNKTGNAEIKSTLAHKLYNEILAHNTDPLPVAETALR